MANTTSIVIRPLGQLVAALSRYGQNLYQPPKDTIRGVEPDTWYSPLQPVKPIGPPGIEPRGFQYYAGQNLLWTPRPDAEHSAADLKQLAQYPLARIAIENVKDSMCMASWQIQPRPEPGESRKAATKRGIGDDKLLKINRFFEMPDREHMWPEWLRPLLEDMLVIDAWCYAPDTEVLTKRGWIKFQDSQIEHDEFATRAADGTFEWQKATELVEKRYRGDLIHFTGRNTDILVTPNHWMLAAAGSSSQHKATKPEAAAWRKSQFGHPGASRKLRYSFVRADKLAEDLKNKVAPATSRWIAPELPSVRLEIPRKPGTRPEFSKFECSGDDFSAFMGMWLAEGCICRGGSSTEILVSQQRASKGFADFRLLLARILGRDCHYNGKVFSFVNNALSDFLRQFGHAPAKFVPDCIKGAAARQIAIFLRYFILGDGCFRKGKTKQIKNAVITTSSHRLADDLQELFQKVGLSASIRPTESKGKFIRGRPVKDGKGFVIYIRSTERILYRKASRIPYDGIVRCVTVPNHTLYVRRNGFPAWCGNTILIRKTFSGEVVEMPVLRGESICRYIDENGFTPLAPEPAYAQLWWGIPLVNLSTDQLVYKPRNIVPRNTIASQLYGMSPTEQLAPEIEIGSKRLEFILAYYSEGSIPGAVQVVPKGVTTDKIAEAMQWMNSELAGNLAKRRQWQLIQGWKDDGKDEQIIFTKEPLLSDMFDEQHTRRIAFGYGISPQRLMRQMNRASAQASQEASEVEGLMPYFSSLKSLMDFIIQRKMGLTDYEMVLEPLVEPDQLKQSRVLTAYVKEGIIRRNEAREKLGEEQAPEPEADMLMVTTGQGAVPLGATTTPAAKPGEERKDGVPAKGKDGEGSAGGDEELDADGKPIVADGRGQPRKPASANKPNGGAAAKAQTENRPIGFAAGTVLTESVPPEHGALTIVAASGEHFIKAKPQPRAAPEIHPGRLLPPSILARHKMEGDLTRTFKTMRRKAVKETAKALELPHEHLAKADAPETLQQILDSLAAEWLTVARLARKPLSDAALAGAAKGSMELDISSADMLGGINEVAGKWAQDNAARLVGMRRDETGALVPNPNPKWAITETTRNDLRTVLTDLFEREGKVSLRDVENRIEQAGTFSDTRASMIANTEISRAQTQGNLEAWRQSRLVEQVNWQTSDDHGEAETDVCDDLEAGSPYDIADVPDLPAHPNCLCALVLKWGEAVE